MNGRRIPHLAAALALAAALHLAVPPPAAAAGFGPAAIAQEGGWLDSAWSWLAAFWEKVAGVTASGPTARWEKEGAGMDPNGTPGADGSGGSTAPGSSLSTHGDEGAGMDPNG